MLSELLSPGASPQPLSPGLQISFSEGRKEYLDTSQPGGGLLSAAPAKPDGCVMAGCTSERDRHSANYGRVSGRARGLRNRAVNEGMGGYCTLSSVSIFGRGC